MRDTEMSREKADALYSVFKQGLESGRFATLYDASRLIATDPAPCFFISAKRASILIGRISSKISLINLNDSQRKLAWHLWFKYQKYLAKHPNNALSRERILEMLVEEPAPEFYTSPEGIRKILYKRLKKIRGENGKNRTNHIAHCLPGCVWDS